MPVSGSVATINNLHLSSVFTTKAKCIGYVQLLPSLLTAKGYISASIDSVWEDSGSVSLLLFPGQKYEWDSLHVTEADWPLLNQLGYYQNSFNSKPFDQQKVTAAYNRLLDYFSNNGYPFAKIYLDSVTLTKDNINAVLHIEKGDLYHIDTIEVYGDIKIAKNFLTHYIDIQEHSIYQQDKLDRINKRLSELPFLLQTQPYSISMLNTGAVLKFYLQNRKSNQVNVLVGFQPSNEQVGGKLLLTGEANLNLRNAFANGETIGINWQQLQVKSPRLNLVFQRPYLFHSPIGVNVNFELYKRDSFFLNVSGRAGASYNISAKQSFTVFVQFNKSNLLNVDTSVIKITKRLPDIIDYSATSLSIQYDFNNTNYRFNPRSGNELQLVTGFGNKHIQQSNAILEIKDPSFNYKSLYDTVQQKGYTFKSRLSAAHYFPLGRQAAFKTGLQAGLLLSPNYFQNELFQVGGFKILRGFDEESIYTNRFAVATFEYRYLLAQNGYFFVFSDGGYAAYQSSSGKYNHTYISGGTGLAFETKTGIFNISYAVGKRNDLKFDLRNSKIHIGFVSLF
ncbi:MAG: hypothetical protein ABI921_08195 [Panacibacter sp.]